MADLRLAPFCLTCAIVWLCLSRTIDLEFEVTMKFLIGSTFLGLVVGLGSLPTTASAAEKAVPQGPVASNEPVAFEVYIPIQNRVQLEKDLDAMHDPGSASYEKWLTPEQFQVRYGASKDQLKAIQDELSVAGLDAKVVSGHHLHVTGPGNMVEQALGTSLETASFASGRKVFVAKQAVTTTPAMTAVGAKIVGLSGRIMMRTHARQVALPDNRYSTHGGYWFDDLKQAYRYPSYIGNTGKGTTIATLTDGAYLPSDMVKYFAHEKLTLPDISEVQVAGGSPFNADSFETMLDLEQAGGMAPGAKIVHYNIPDLSDNSIIDGLSQILTENKADIVSMSFGEPEVFYTAEYNDGVDFTFIPQIYDDLFAQGNAQGITFGASSGDSGALAAVPAICFTGVANCGHAIASVQFPASSPHVTAVGGTNLVTVSDGATKDSTYVSEEAFGDPLSKDIFYGTSAIGSYWGSGGGDSILFYKPSFQKLVQTGNNKVRTVPDIAFHMGGCPGGVLGTCNPDDSFDYEVFNNLYYGAIGTSAGAPDLAGLAALAIQREGHRIGNVNYRIYQIASIQNAGLPVKAFHHGIPGFNGKYFGSAAPYNRVTGNGTVRGIDLLLDPHGAVAGVPQTPSNP